MRIFITGATGFVGREICRQLLSDGHSLTILARSKSRIPYFLENERVKFHIGDVTVAASLEGALKDHDAVIHLVGIIREIPEKNITFKRLHLDATNNIIKVAINAEVFRFLHMSALGVGPKAKGAYFETKWLAEESLRASGLHSTIFRPSLIYGAGDKFTNMIADMIRKFRIFPLFDGGMNRMQPIAVEDVAMGFSMALMVGNSIGRIYEVGGPETLRFKEIVKIIGQAIGINPLTPAIPVKFIKPIVKRLETMKWFPITTNQLEMLLTDNITASKMLTTDLGITPVDFKSGVRKYLKKKVDSGSTLKTFPC